MTKQLAAISLLLTLLASGSALAVGPGRILDFNEDTMGMVVFDGTTHKNAGLDCKDCHNPDVFPKMKQGSVKMTMKEMYEGKFCGKCHDGKNGFLIKASCDRCHFKAGA
jgi:c(7)-type cytochrome triheme protein